jgi:hypothetical protein
LAERRGWFSIGALVANGRQSAIYTGVFVSDLCSLVTTVRKSISQLFSKSGNTRIHQMVSKIVAFRVLFMRQSRSEVLALTVMHVLFL